jgi:hypothetical protein
MHTNTASSRITATLVEDLRRLEFLPHYFGKQMMLVERHIFTHMRELCDGYRGGHWHYFALSNGGCFLAPSDREPLSIAVHGNGYAGIMSAEAAGICATLFALSHLSFRFTHVELFAERFHQLRDFAIDHPEASAIFAAID